MTSSGDGIDLYEAVSRQQDTIDKLLAAVEMQQRQLDALWRRVQDLEGVPVPDREPPES